MATKGRKTLEMQPEKAVGGIHVYQDDKNRFVYYNVFNKTAYILTDHEKEFRTYSQRFVLGLVAVILTYLFDIPFLFCIVIGVIAYGLMEIKFRKFLSRLPQIPGFVPKKRTSAVEKEAAQDFKKIVLKAILTFLLGILLIINADMQKYTGMILYLNWILSISAFALCVIEIRALFTKRK